MTAAYPGEWLRGLWEVTQESLVALPRAWPGKCPTAVICGHRLSPSLPSLSRLRGPESLDPQHVGLQGALSAVT